jgi:ABC-2 type transport system permease protein
MSRIYYLEARNEFLKLVRMRAYTVFTILFPLTFYCFFGLAMGKQGPKDAMPMARYLLATYGAYAVMGATLSAFGVGVAVERGMGWLQLKRSSPMPPAAYFVAKGVVSVLFSSIVVGLLFGLGAGFGGVRMPLMQWLALGGTLVAGTIPFCALGLAIGNFSGPNSASPTVNMIFMPLAFCGGLWIPLQFLPSALHQVAYWLPSYHYAQIALRVLGAPVEGSAWQHLEAMAAFTLIFGGIAWLGESRGQEKLYG